jgi:hypothetical protein
MPSKGVIFDTWSDSDRIRQWLIRSSLIQESPIARPKGNVTSLIFAPREEQRRTLAIRKDVVLHRPVEPRSCKGGGVESQMPLCVSPLD